MKQVLRIVLILALVLLPLRPLDAYADEHDLGTLSEEDEWVEQLLISLGIAGGLTIIGWLAYSANGDEQETLLAEQLEQLEPIENVGPQTNFTSPEHANVHGAIYPVFEW